MKRFSHLLKAAFLLLSLIPGLLSAQDTLTIVAVGDVMLGTIFSSRSDLADEETAKHFFDEMKPFFKGGEIVFCNTGEMLADSLVKFAGKLGTAPIFRIRMGAKTGDFIDFQHVGLLNNVK